MTDDADVLRTSFSPPSDIHRTEESIEPLRHFIWRHRRRLLFGGDDAVAEKRH